MYPFWSALVGIKLIKGATPRIPHASALRLGRIDWRLGSLEAHLQLLKSWLHCHHGFSDCPTFLSHHILCKGKAIIFSRASMKSPREVIPEGTRVIVFAVLSYTVQVITWLGRRNVFCLPSSPPGMNLLLNLLIWRIDMYNVPEFNFVVCNGEYLPLYSWGVSTSFRSKSSPSKGSVMAASRCKVANEEYMYTYTYMYLYHLAGAKEPCHFEYIHSWFQSVTEHAIQVFKPRSYSSMCVCSELLLQLLVPSTEVPHNSLQIGIIGYPYTFNSTGDNFITVKG